MRRRIYDKDGRPAWSDDGPAYARRQGNGGAALGQAYATFVVHQRKAAGKADAEAAKRHRRTA